MLQEKILEAARPYLEGRAVTDLVLGIALIGAQLDGENVGVSYMLRDSLPSGCGSFGFARQALGKDAYEVARLLVEGIDDAQRGLGAAVLNAASHSVPLMFCADDVAAPFGVAIQPGDKLALVGYMATLPGSLRAKLPRRSSSTRAASSQATPTSRRAPCKQKFFPRATSWCRAALLW